jgi:hypothetical protein
LSTVIKKENDMTFNVNQFTTIQQAVTQAQPILNKEISSSWFRRKVFLSYHNQTGWKIQELGLFARILRTLHLAYNDTHSSNVTRKLAKLDPQQLTEISAQLDSKMPTIFKRVFPTYAKPMMNDPHVSQPVKDLFRLLFIDMITPKNIKHVQPLESQLSALNEKLKKFNKKHGTSLSFMSSAHASDKNDPWQTIKITDPKITTVGQLSPVLAELNDLLFEKYGLQSNGGDNWTKGITAGQKKYPPACFFHDKQKKVFTPQLLISLIDIARVIGMISTKEEYLKTLSDAYSPGFKGHQFLN